MPTDIDAEFADGAGRCSRRPWRADPDGGRSSVLRRGAHRTGEVDGSPTRWRPRCSPTASQRGDRLAVYLQNVPQFVLGLVGHVEGGRHRGVDQPDEQASASSTTCSTDSGARVLVCLRVALRRRGRASVAGRHGGAHGDHHQRARLPDGDDPALFAGVARAAPDGTARPRRAASTAHDGEHRRRSTLGPDDVAFLTYTSGTTGPPKGAMNTHAQRRVQLPGVPRVDAT